jgi:uncharacterized protein (DUF58 family)
MMRQLLNLSKNNAGELVSSDLYDEETFYAAFLKDLNKCGSEVIIESPFVANRRAGKLLPVLQKLKSRHVKVIVNTRDPNEHDNYLRSEAHQVLAGFQQIGVQVIYTEGHHRKMAVLDRNILWEGSLNILSQNNSREVMRRTVSTRLAWQMVHFTKLDLLIN